MSELRQLLRYEIPILLILLDTSLIVLCNINISKFLIGLGGDQASYIDIIKLFPGLSIIAALMGLPLGWLLYQIYDACYMPHYKRNSLKVLRELMKNRPLPRGIRADEESNYEELIDSLLFNDESDNKSVLYGLNNYRYQHDARYIVGFYVPLISVALGAYSLYFLGSNYLVCPLSSIFRSVNFIALFLINLYVLPCIVFKSHDRILDEIEAREIFFIYLKKGEIEKFRDDENLHKLFKAAREK